MKTHHTSTHSGHEQSLGLVDQDAAIDAYLDGLLRDPNNTPYWTDDSSTDPVDEYEEDYPLETMGDFQQPKRPVGLSLVDLSKFKTPMAEPEATEVASSSPQIDEPVQVQSTEVDSVVIEVAESVVVEWDESEDTIPEAAVTDAISLEMAAEEQVELAEEYEAAISVAPIEQLEPPVDVTPAAAQQIESPWQVFAVGHLKVALPRAEVFGIVDGSTLRAIPGAPASVAGAVTYQDRSRMVLSLDAWMPKVNADAQVVLLGAQGLWGVRVGTELTDLSWDDAETSWRDTDERTAGRPWLAGVNRIAGVAFLAVEALRSALSAPGRT